MFITLDISDCSWPKYSSDIREIRYKKRYFNKFWPSAPGEFVRYIRNPVYACQLYPSYFVRCGEASYIWYCERIGKYRDGQSSSQEHISVARTHAPYTNSLQSEGEKQVFWTSMKSRFEKRSFPRSGLSRNFLYEHFHENSPEILIISIWELFSRKSDR